jgi:soluble lytic murein transglycosylase-like protein
MACPPKTNKERLASHIRQNHHLFVQNEWGLCPDAVMFGWIEQESSWNPYATREEPGFFRTYIIPNVGKRARERFQLAMSYGLLQIMGRTARLELGFKGKYLTELCDPALNLHLAAKYLRKQMAGGDGSWGQGLAAYNGGLGKIRGVDNRTAPYRNQSYVDEVVHRARRYAARG